MINRFANYPSLRGRGVVITGGASGIGRAIAEAFARQGAHVAVLDRDAEEGNRVASGLGESHLFFPCDVTDTPQLRHVVKRVAEKLGRLDVVVANAADDSRHEVAAVTPELWEAAFAVNLGHQFFVAQAAQPFLSAGGGGVIICLGSIAWMNDTAEMVAYTAAKSGVHGLVRTLARLWGQERIRVNALVPGWTMTERQLREMVDDEAEELIERSQCLPGRVTPEDLARMALFLASDDAAMITRQAFVVDGGWV